MRLVELPMPTHGIPPTTVSADIGDASRHADAYFFTVDNRDFENQHLGEDGERMLRNENGRQPAFDAPRGPGPSSP